MAESIPNNYIYIFYYFDLIKKSEIFSKTIKKNFTNEKVTSEQGDNF